MSEAFPKVGPMVGSRAPPVQLNRTKELAFGGKPVSTNFGVVGAPTGSRSMNLRATFRF